MKDMSETWIVFKANDMSAPGWEERKLLPFNSLTDILWENWDYSGKLPEIGSRIREYVEIASDTYGRDGDWVVTQIHQFSSFDTNRRIVICNCEYQLITTHWEKLPRGLPITEMGQVSEVR